MVTLVVVAACLLAPHWWALRLACAARRFHGKRGILLLGAAAATAYLFLGER